MMMMMKWESTGGCKTNTTTTTSTSTFNWHDHMVQSILCTIFRGCFLGLQFSVYHHTSAFQDSGQFFTIQVSFSRLYIKISSIIRRFARYVRFVNKSKKNEISVRIVIGLQSVNHRRRNKSKGVYTTLVYYWPGIQVSTSTIKITTIRMMGVYHPGKNTVLKRMYGWCAVEQVNLVDHHCRWLLAKIFAWLVGAQSRTQ
jgi:hypothetical protein